MFGPEWPATRTFPTDTVIEGAQLDFGPGLVFSVMDIGPAESFHDSVFLLDGPRPVAFAGDLAYGLMHPYMADNTNPDWRAALDRLRRELAEDLPLYIGHGAPVTTGFLDWQETYLDLFEAAIRNADWSDGDAATAAVMRRMKDYLPSDDLVFLAQLSVLPNAKRLGML
jgi:glyoxylase-like metal-dependent hydrolase (beta-lactamase superfamily II)